jgi:hypothetical protein
LAKEAALLASLAGRIYHDAPQQNANPLGDQLLSIVFPLTLAQLDRQRVLLIAIPASSPRMACFASGAATYEDGRLRVAYATDRPDAVVDDSRQSVRGFDPTVLPRLIVAAQRNKVLQLARGSTACVAASVPSPLPGALNIEDAFFGLSMNQLTGEVFLMQGDDP